MAEIKKNERYIPLKNYVIAGLVIVFIIAITCYSFAWYKVFKENKVSTSYLVQEKIVTNEIKNLEEISDIFSEVPESYFVYISYTGSEEVYNMEKDLKNIIKEYNLTDSIYYLNVTNIKENENYIEEINKAFNLEEKKVTQVPTIIYYNNGKVVDIVKRNDDNIMNVGDFQKLLDVNNVAKE